MTAAPLPLPPAGFRAGTRGPSLVPPPPRRAELALEPRPRLRDGLDSEPRPNLSSRVPALGRGSRGRGGSGAGPSGSSGKFPCGRASPGARPGPASPPAEPLGPFCPRDGPSRSRGGLGARSALAPLPGLRSWALLHEPGWMRGGCRPELMEAAAKPSGASEAARPRPCRAVVKL